MQPVLEPAEPTDAIAVIGLSCRLPDAATPAQFWANLCNGHESSRQFTDEELRKAGSDPANRGRGSFVDRGILLADTDLFDAGFFDFNPRDAEILDPQQRLFLECAWEALEDAGYDPSTENALIGVFGGTDIPAYLLRLYNRPDILAAVGEFALALANDKDHLTTRVAYKLNLKGPAVTVQTGCSTSLVAVCQACKELLHYGCDIALAGGSGISMAQGGGYFWQEGGILSPDGHCRAFDAAAQGTISGSGAGIVVLKRYEEARADRDNIYAIIRGFGVNNDGSGKIGYTAPSVHGQANVILNAITMAGVDPDTLSYVEAHGTGTPLGDPIEITALTQVFRRHTNRKRFCGIGSVKTNIGHLNSAAGIAGLIKTVLSLKHKTLPPSLNYQRPNPAINLDESPFFVVDRLRPWENANGVRRAAVSSFGMGGTNAHVILEETPEENRVANKSGWHLWPLSAKTPTALDRLTENLISYIASQPEISANDIGHTLQVGRQAFTHRRALLVETTASSARDLASAAESAISANAIDGAVPVVFMFPGQGVQHVGMGEELYDTLSSFRAHIDSCCGILTKELGLDLREVLYGYGISADPDGGNRRLLQTELAQPALFMIEYAVAQLWIEWGVHPAAMVGHSVGEYVAACLAGVFPLADALRLIAQRGRLMQSMPAGGMLTVYDSGSAVRHLLDDTLSLAAENGPTLCVLSGTFEAVEHAEADLTTRGVHHRRLHTSHAFHSAMMDPIVAAFVDEVRNVELRKPKLPYLSNLTGTWITAEQATDPSYWGDHLRRSVRFAANLATLQDGSPGALLEVGPGRSLITLAEQSGGGRWPLRVASLPHQHDGAAPMKKLLEAAGTLWANGVALDWHAISDGETYRRVSLPTYPFEGQRHWIDFPSGNGTAAVVPPKALSGGKLDMDYWFYTPIWKPAPAPELATHSPGAPYLFFSAEEGWTAELAQVLGRRGHRPTTISASGSTDHLIDSSDPTAYVRLVRTLRQSGLIPRQIVYSANAPLGHAPVTRRSVPAFFELLYIAQAIAEAFPSEDIELTLLTDGSARVMPRDRIAPGEAMLAGASKVISQEFPNVHTRVIDVAIAGTRPDERDFLLSILATELESKPNQPVIALRANGRWLQSYEQASLDPAAAIRRLRRNGVYVITGGLGGMGLTLAGHLAKKVNAKLALIGRTPLPDRPRWAEWLGAHPENDRISGKLRQILEMEAAGAEVTIEVVDVADPAAMRAVADRVRRKYGQVNGVIHAAGTPGGGIIQLKTAEQAERVLAPKLRGAEITYNAFANESLDFFVLCSSLSSILGGFGQIDYAAANCYMDAFAAGMAPSETLVVSVNWDTWAEVGMAVETEVPHDLRKYRDESLKHAITPAEGARALDFILSGTGPQVLVSTTALQERLEQASKPASAAEIVAPETANRTHARRNLSTPYMAPRDSMEETVARAWSQVLGIDPIGIDDDFLECGGHSLMAVQLASLLRREIQSEISVAAFFESPTVSAIAARLRGGAGAAAGCPELKPKVRPELLPLSYAQQRLWFLYWMEGPSATYNIAVALKLTGNLDNAALKLAFRDVLERHESLRTIFPEQNGVPYQEILPVENVDVPFELADVDVEALSDRLMTAAATRFDLVRELPVRTWLFRLDAQRNVLVIVLHHIAADGWSLGPLARDLAIAYGARSQARAPEFTNLAIQYADYTLWQREVLGDECESRSKISEQLEFWRSALAGAPEESTLETDRPRPPRTNYRGASVPLCLDASLHARLLELARAGGASLFMVLHAAFAALLTNSGASDDILIGTPVAGRAERVLEDLIGCFINTLVLRTNASGNPSFNELLARVRAFDLEAFDRQDVPFERVVEALQPARSVARHPLFQVMLVLQNTPVLGLALPGVSVSLEPLRPDVAKFDLTLDIAEQVDPGGAPAGIAGGLEYRSELFDQTTAEAVASRFVRLLDAVTARPASPLSELGIPTTADRETLLSSFNATTHPVPATTLPALVEAQAARTPEAVAVSCGRTALTYAELNAAANALAHRLIALGVGPEARVGVCLERSLDLVVALLATMKAGGAYVPLDPEYPEARLSTMLMDAAPAVVVTTRALCRRVPDATAVLVDDPHEQALLATAAGHNPTDAERRAPLHPLHPAYVIYTSGSTGTPKGVVVRHGELANYLTWASALYRNDGQAGAPINTPLAFDATVTSLYVPLLLGWRVHLLPENGQIEALADLLASGADLSLVKLTPAHLEALRGLLGPKASAVRARLFVVGGETLPAAVAAFWREHVPGLRIVNEYGPTETVVGCCVYELGPEPPQGAEVPIGRPTPNTRLYVLGRALEPVPIGVTGELYIGGSQLGAGYLNRTALTAERFVADPYAATPGARMYRTGDLARWRADGTLEFRGRVDTQVKLRGFRVELGEIEAALTAHSEVSQAVVLAREDAPGAKRLVAHVVSANESYPDTTALRRYLNERLPEYMVPAAFVVLPSLPLTPNGKLDRRALSEPDAARSAYRAPSTLNEEILCGLFAEVLAVERVSRNDNFFSLGGDSILSILLVSRARRTGLELTPRDVFEQPTIAALAAVARMSASPGVEAWDDDAGVGEVIPTPIMRWLLSRGGPIQRFNQSVLLRVPAEVVVEHLIAALQALLDIHDALRFQYDAQGTCCILPRQSVAAAECFQSVELFALDEGARQKRMQAEASEATARLAPQQGRMVQAVLFRWTGESRLLLVIHHFAVDGVSWRVLVPDLATAYAAAARGAVPRLERPGTPFRVWAEHVSSQAQREARLSELPAWEALLKSGAPLLPEAQPHPAQDTVANAGQFRLTLSPTLTHALLTTVAPAFHAGIEEILLAALAVAVAAWRREHQRSHVETLMVNVEAHGRDSHDSGFDVSHTVGWFTTLYPIALSVTQVDLDEALSGGPAIGEACKQVKEQLRAVPNRGLGYAQLRYLNQDAGPRLARHDNVQLGFNYFGRVPLSGRANWAPAPELLTTGVDPELPLPYILDINAVTLDAPDGSRLSSIWNWARRHLEDRDVTALAEYWERALAALCHHCSVGGSGRTPSDFPLAELSQDELEWFEERCPDLQDVLPLTPLQQGLVFHAVYDETTTDVYTVQVVAELEGDLQPERLHAAAATLLQRHANLRASIQHAGIARPLQVIARDVEVPWRTLDLSSFSERDQRREQCDFVDSDRVRRFDISKPPLFRFTLLRIRPDRHVLVFTYHHVLLDGWSTPLLFRELFTLYRNGGDAGALPQVRPYSDYLAWLAAQDHNRALKAWQDYVAGFEAPSYLGGPNLNAPITIVPARRVHLLSAELTAQVQTFARTRGVTVNTLLQGVWAVLLARMTLRHDVVFGVTVSGRPAELAHVEEMVGLFINTIPVRVRVRPHESVESFLVGLQNSQAQLIPYQHVGLSELQQLVGCGPLFDTLIGFENYPLDRAAFGDASAGLRILSVTGHDTTHYAVTLVVTPGEQLHLRLDYDPSRFSPQNVDALGLYVERLLYAAITHSKARLYQLDLLSPAERHSLLAGVNTTARAIPERSIGALFEEQAQRTPDAAAVAFGDRTLSYGELNASANQLAHHLRSLGVGRGDFVALRLEHGPELIVSLLAILKAGAAYVPLDLAYPRQRVEQMLADCRAKLLLTTPDRNDELQETDVPVAVLADILRALEADPHAPKENPAAAGWTEAAAYVMYTSGSTGTPKGILVPHRAIVRLVREADYAQIGPGDRVAQMANTSFDAATFEIWSALLNGGTVVILDRETTLSPTALRSQILDQHIDTLFLTTALFNQIAVEAPDCFTAVRDVLFGGEAVDPRRVRRILECGAPERLLHVYGPTENTTFTTWHLVREVAEEARTIPIGRAISNTRVYILDSGLEPVPVGATGELYTAGAGLALGYVEQPSATGQRFVADPYGEPGSLMYRTGDLARWVPEGAIEFLGRADQQIKIRGFRIELAEIEAALTAHPEVAQAVIVPREDGQGGKQIIAYVVPAKGAVPPAAELRRSLGDRLPEYMVPASFVTLDRLPLTPNGKVDRKALPSSDLQTDGYRPPRSGDEVALCGIFAEVLGVERVGIDDNFFALGGHSLAAMRLVSRVRAFFNVEVSVYDVLTAASVKDLNVTIQALLIAANGTQHTAATARDELEEEVI